MTRRRTSLCFEILGGVVLLCAPLGTSASPSYGVDCSFSIHHFDFLHPSKGNTRECPISPKAYEDYWKGCVEAYDEESCLEGERERLEENLRKPQSLLNMTETGYFKIETPPQLWTLIEQFWEERSPFLEGYFNGSWDADVNDEIDWHYDEEDWGVGDTLVNHWEADTLHMDIYDGPDGKTLVDTIWDVARPLLEEWTGKKQRASSIYGVRIYQNGSILTPHVDRFPLVSSVIINVAQDVEEDWPLEVYDRQGNAVNVTLQPGEMIFYESGSLIHGRPFPLKGKFYANIFIHFEPYAFLPDSDKNETGDQPLRLWLNQHNPDLPPYVLPDSPEAEYVLSSQFEDEDGYENFDYRAHNAARKGDMEDLVAISRYDFGYFTTRDQDGWLPIHEAAYSGQIEALSFLLEYSTNINVRTSFGQGETPLALAEMNHMLEMVEFLKSKGAESIRRNVQSSSEATTTTSAAATSHAVPLEAASEL